MFGKKLTPVGTLCTDYNYKDKNRKLNFWAQKLAYIFLTFNDQIPKQS